MTPPIAASMEKNGGGPSTAPANPVRPQHATSLATTGPEARNNRQARRLFGIPNRRGFIMTVLPNSTVRSFLSDPEAARKVYAKLLRRAFPETSDAAIAKRAAPVLGEDEKTIRRHLRLNHSVKVEHFLAVALLAGVEFTLAAIFSAQK